ncbi:MAG TPA: cell envelope integrity protein CreD [Burkholderiales bacterium]|nr:cell envelope integrity protein CreD [Burkholderiales bacterium]
MRFPLLARAGAVAGVAVAILIPLQLVNGKIAERQARAFEVERSFAAETSGPQTIAGPLLALTCEETYVEERQIMREGKAETVADRKTRPCPTGYFVPRTLEVAGRLPVEARSRGIYPIRLYRAALELAGELDWPPPPSQEGAIARVWKQAYVVVVASDPRGIKSVSPLRWGEGTLAFASARSDADPRFALQASAGSYASQRAGQVFPFRFAVELIGTTRFGVAPVGDATLFRLNSTWPHPSFTGAWLPDARTITADGFDATWRTTHFATGGQAAWQKQARGGELFTSARAAGIDLFDPVNVYALAHRATEYGFLFVLFTFAGLALAEVMAGVRLHAIQYALVGSALAVFFLLLIALAEHTSFATAYAAAAAACVTLLAVYLRHPLGTPARTLAFFALFALMYGTLYVLLLSEDHALLTGSLLVFGALAIVMLATRRLDWTALGERLPRKAGASGAARAHSA